MMEIAATPYFLKDRPAELGESIIPTSHGLLQVSIPEAALLILDPSTPGTYRELPFRNSSLSSVGSAVETIDRTLLVASSSGLLRYDCEKKALVKNFGTPDLAGGRFESPDDLERVRFNDGKVGPQGRAYFGVIFDTSEARKAKAGKAALVSIGHDGKWKLCIDGLTTPNGGCWDSITESSATFYLSDTPSKKVNIYHHNLVTDEFAATGAIDMSAECWGKDAEEWGRPDGMAIADWKENGTTKSVLLLAMFAGNAVMIVDPSKPAPENHVGTIRVEASKVTSVVVVGHDAYITTGKSGDSSSAGATFKADLRPLGIIGRVTTLAWK